jgi:hypothetical protein
LYSFRAGDLYVQINVNEQKAFMPLAMLMDFWNNRQGANASASDSYATADGAFESKKGNLIMRNQDVASAYGWSEDDIVTKQFGDNEPIWGFNVKFDYNNGIVENIRLSK